MSVQISSVQDFDEKILKAEKLALVDFWAPWCGPCRMVGPIVEEVSNEYADQVIVAKVNVDDLQDIAVRYGIMSIPTLILFKNGNILDQTIGAPTKTKLVSWVNTALNKVSK